MTSQQRRFTRRQKSHASAVYIRVLCSCLRRSSRSFHTPSTPHSSFVTLLRSPREPHLLRGIITAFELRYAWARVPRAEGARGGGASGCAHDGGGGHPRFLARGWTRECYEYRYRYEYCTRTRDVAASYARGYPLPPPTGLRNGAGSPRQKGAAHAAGQPFMALAESGVAQATATAMASLHKLSTTLLQYHTKHAAHQQRQLSSKSQLDELIIDRNGRRLDPPPSLVPSEPVQQGKYGLVLAVSLQSRPNRCRTLSRSQAL